MSYFVPRLGKKELICLMLFTFNYVVSVPLWMGYVILFLSLPYNYFNSLSTSVVC